MLLAVQQRADSSWDPTALTPEADARPLHEARGRGRSDRACVRNDVRRVEDPDLVSCVLRSWEDRFHAILVGLAPGTVVLAVGAPPVTFDHALHIAAEQVAFAPNEESGAPGALTRQARTLLRNPHDPWTRRDLWNFVWND
jgi:hypothetical protein